MTIVQVIRSVNLRHFFPVSDVNYTSELCLSLLISNKQNKTSEFKYLPD